MKTKEQQINLFFMSVKRLETFIKNNTDNSCVDIIEIEKKILQKHKDTLKSIFNIDAEAYLNSIEGQIEYISFCVQEKNNQDLSERCDRCSHYFMKHPNEDEMQTGCDLFDVMPMNCKQFHDTGKDFVERLFLTVDRCTFCKNLKKTKEILEDKVLLEFQFCSLGLNELAIDCSNFNKNTQTL